MNYGGYPLYWLYDGSPSMLQPLGLGLYEAQQAQNTFDNLAYPIGDSGYVGGEEAFAGLDLPTLSNWSRQLGQQLGTWGTEAAQALGGIPHSFGQGAASTWAPLGDAPQKASAAADATRAVANDARATLDRLNAAAEHTSRGAQSVSEAAEVAKYAIIGLSILGGAALVYYIAK